MAVVINNKNASAKISYQVILTRLNKKEHIAKILKIIAQLDKACANDDMGGVLTSFDNEDDANQLWMDRG